MRLSILSSLKKHLGRIRQTNIRREYWVIVYRLIREAFVLILIALPFFLIAEGLLPGILSERMGIGLVFACLAGLIFLGQISAAKLGITHKPLRLNHMPLAVPMSVFAILLLGNSMLRFAFWENIAITLAALLISYWLLKNIFEGKN